MCWHTLQRPAGSLAPLAIEFATQSFISAAGGGVFRAAAYQARGIARDDISGETFSFQHRRMDLIRSGIYLPENAPEWAADTSELWNRATRAEMCIDRKTGELRFARRGGNDPQVARSIVLALPKELSDEQNHELLMRYVSEHNPGVAVQWAIHRGDDGNGNVHAHLLIATRAFDGDGFRKKKSRDLSPDVAKGRVVNRGEFSREWADFQNEFFREKGLDLRVDPTRAVAEQHRGYRDENEADRQRAAEAREAARDDTRTLTHLTSRQSTFSQRDLEVYLAKSGLDEPERAERIRAIMERADLVRLEEIRRGESGQRFAVERFTTRDIIDMERETVAAAVRLSEREARSVAVGAIDQIAARRTLDREQREALDLATDNRAFALIRGDAGTGKSHTIGAIREAHEHVGARVVGLSTTHDVVADLSRDGFTEARTVASQLNRLEAGRDSWDPNTVVIVDEAAMLSNRDFAHLLEHVERTGARAVFVGDDKQHSSVVRGGIFSDVARQVPVAELTEVRRQREEWQRKASNAAARGDFAATLNAYHARGALSISAEQAQAERELISDWKGAAQAGELPAIYAATNVAVDRINSAAREARRELGQIEDADHVFQTKRGDTERTTAISRGDRIEFNAPIRDRRAGLDIKSRAQGTVEEVDGDRLTVRMESGKRAIIDTREHQNWGLAYASTVYRGQGKTKAHVLALVDSPFAWRSNSAYVGLTRHKDSLRLYASQEIAPDLKAMSRLMSRGGGKRSAVSMRELPAREQIQERQRRAALASLDGPQRGPDDAQRRREALERLSERSASPTLEQRREAYERALREDQPRERGPEDRER